MNATLLMLINSAAVTLEDLVEAINSHEGRETASRDVIRVAKCDLCGKGFPRQPQDSRLAEDHGHRVVCYRNECRRELKQLQNADNRTRRKNS